MIKSIAPIKTIILLSAFLLTSCASDPVLLTKSAEEDYNKAEYLMEDGNYAGAAMFLEKFSAKYPYSQYATSSELLRLEAAFKDEQYVLSETLGLRFADAHPDHKDRIYAEYLVAMSYYKQSSSSQLDQQFSHRSRDAFLTLNKQFPNNAYTQDIQKYLAVLTNRVAENEMLIGKYYFNKNLYVAAVNRFLFVKNKYMNADIAAESLYWLTSTYVELDLQTYAKEAKDLLQQKFPQSEWHKKAELLM